MHCIKVLTDKDFNLEVKEFNNPRIRYGARGIVFNDKNQIAILNKANKNEYKLVGGGIEGDEDPMIAFKREVLEEAGCIIEIDKCLGTFKEEKSQGNFIQTSYVYVAHVIVDTKHQNFTQIKDSENKLKPSKYEGVYHTKFVVRRDYEILKYYLDNN